MLDMVAADVLSFMYPGFLKEVLTGSVGGVHITAGFLVAARPEGLRRPSSLPRSALPARSLDPPSLHRLG